MMKKFSKGTIAQRQQESKGYLAGIFLPETELEHDDKLEMKYEKFTSSISAAPHIHTKSKTWVIVIKGQMVFKLDGEVFEINGGEYLIFESGVVEEVVSVQPGTESISLHAPSIVGGDKVNV